MRGPEHLLPGDMPRVSADYNAFAERALQAVEGYPLLRTDRNGWIELTTDGEQMWVEVEKR